MPLQLLLLLTLLGPGSSLKPWETWKSGAKEVPGPLLARGRRQLALIPTLTLTCGGSRAQGPMDHLAHAGARMEEILPFGWRGYYGNSEVEAKGLLS